MMDVMLEQEEIITKLVAHNRHLIQLLAQFTSVEEEEKRLKREVSDATLSDF